MSKIVLVKFSLQNGTFTRKKNKITLHKKKRFELGLGSFSFRKNTLQ